MPQCALRLSERALAHAQHSTHEHVRALACACRSHARTRTRCRAAAVAAQMVSAFLRYPMPLRLSLPSGPEPKCVLASPTPPTAAVPTAAVPTAAARHSRESLVLLLRALPRLPPAAAAVL
jgi:hypothetical protein